MAIVRGNETIPLHTSPVFHHYAMDSHTKPVQHSKSAVHSKVSKTSDSIRRTEKRKTYSLAEMPLKALKKRGVYVQKKGGSRPRRGDLHVSPLIQAYMAHTSRGKHHRRSPLPKRRNTFVTDALSVLSNKSAASTQYPPISDVLPRTHLLPMSLKRHASVSTNDGAAQDSRAEKEDVSTAKEIVGKVLTVSKPKKHKTRGHKRRRSPRGVLVLKSQTNIVQTPSNMSQNEQIRKERKHKGRKRSAAKELQRSIYQEHESRIANAVLEGQEYKTTRRKLVDDQPVTLVSTMDQPEDKGLYKLFMNLLETTFSVYNVDTDHRNPTIGSKYDERLHRDRPQCYTVTDNLPHQYHARCCRQTPACKKPRSAALANPWRRTPGYAKPKPKLLRKRVLRSSPSQYFYRSIKRQLAQSFPDVMRGKVKKALVKTPKKETLLGMLRHELHMEANRPREPNNLYQALRVIANNKLKHQRLTRFREERNFERSPSPDRYTGRKERKFEQTPSPERYTGRKERKFEQTPSPERYTGRKERKFEHTPSPERYTGRRERKFGHTPSPERYSGRKERKFEHTPSPERYSERRTNLTNSAIKPRKHFISRRSFMRLKEQFESNDSDDEVILPQIEDVSSYRTLEVLAYDKKDGADSKRNLDSEDSASWDSAQ